MRAALPALGSMFSLVTACGGAAAPEPSSPPPRAAAVAEPEADLAVDAPADESCEPPPSDAHVGTCLPEGEEAPPTLEASPAEAPSDGEPLESAPVALPEGTKVLQVGDSFSGALGVPLGQLLEKEGVRSVLKSKDASYLTDWAWDGDLKKYIWKYRPDLIIITLGANELKIGSPERRKSTIKRITDTMGAIPCLWVGIPLWDGPQNGLMDIVKDSVGPCVYWDSNELLDAENMPRIHDGIHPTASAREAWAKEILEWLRLHRRTDGELIWSLREEVPAAAESAEDNHSVAGAPPRPETTSDSE